MSTRSIIARPDRDSFTGRYVHCDGYPQGVRKTLYSVYNGHFHKDIKAMMKYFIDDHPAGWSSIYTADFKLKPGFSELRRYKGDYDTYSKSRYARRPQCYCHGDRREEEQAYTSEMSTDTEWAYVVNEKTHHMHIMCHAGFENGDFVHGKDQWRYVADIDLDGDEPDWELIRESQRGLECIGYKVEA